MRHSQRSCRNLLSLSILYCSLAVIIVLTIPNAVAQTNSAPEPPQTYDIASGPLSGVLSQFAADAGILLTANAAMTDGIASRGLNGTYAIEDALHLLLVGTGLTVSKEGSSYIIVEEDSGAVKLPPVKISAAIASATTENTRSYTTDLMSTATLLPLSIRETPQSVTVMTTQRIEDQALKTATDLLRNTPGISSTATAPYRETFYSRGFDIDTYLLDGLPIIASDTRRGNLLTDLAMYDRTEVVRGSAGLMQGSGTPSAAINFVRKRPTKDTQFYVQGEAGRWNHAATEADVSGPLNTSGGLRARGVARWQDSDSFMDLVTEDRQLVYLVGEYDVTDSTLFSLSFARQENKNVTGYGGLPTAEDGSDLNLPRSTYLGNDWNYWDDDITSLYFTVEHLINNDWSATLAVNRIWGDEEMVRAGVNLNETGGWDQGGGKANYNHDRLSYGANAKGTLQLFNRIHDLVIGASYREGEQKQATAGYWPGPIYATDIDIFNWTHDAPEPDFEIDYYSDFKETEYGAHITARIDLAAPLKLILGLRVDWFEYQSESEWNEWDGTARTGWTNWGEDYDYDSHDSLYGGLIYDISRQYSVYASYTEIFKAQSQKTRSNDFIEPIVGENYELGLKGEYFDGSLNVSATLFRLDEGNKAVSDGVCPFDLMQTCYRPAGLVRSEGYELEMQGQLTQNWQIGAGFTSVKKRIEEDPDNPDSEGTNPETDLPENQFKVSTTYRFPNNQWRIGGAARWQDDIYFESYYDDIPVNYRSEQRAYTVVDLMVGYKPIARLDLQVNVSNVTDETYYSSIQAQPSEWGGNAVYGEPRNILLTVRYAF